MQLASYPSELKITDMRFAALVNAPMPSTIIRLETNQGIVGYGEIRDFANPLYALMLKKELLGENPCDIEKLFRRIRKYGAHGRRGGGVSAVETALFDLIGKAYGIPVYQLLGGKYRENIRCYCDTHIHGRHTGSEMGKALKARLAEGFTFLKMNLKPGQFESIPLCVPGGREIQDVPGAFSTQHYTQQALDVVEEYVGQVRGEIGYQIPLAIDHIGHFTANDCIQLARRLEKYNLAWIEDPQPWFMTEAYQQIARGTTAPIATGEDIYLAESFLPLLRSGALSVVHPDPMTLGGIAETKKLSDLAQNHGAAMAIHMAGTPVAAMAAAHAAAASENFLVMEFHAEDVPWWNDMVKSAAEKPLLDAGFIHVSQAPGLGIESLDDEVLQAHADPNYPQLWNTTEKWDSWPSRDKDWS